MDTNKIDFFIIGAQKSGTTSLYDLLTRHSDVFMPKIKELQCFVYDEHYQHLRKCLNLNFPDHKENVLWGAAQVQMLFHKKAAERLYQHNPNCKIVLMLRNPVERAYSGYWYAKQFGYEDASSFEEAIALESNRLNSEDEHILGNLTHIAHSRYDEQIARYLRYFNKEAIKVVIFEDFKKNQDRVVKEVLGFLNLKMSPGLLGFLERSNAARMPKSRALHNILKSKNSFLKRVYRVMLPEVFRQYLNLKLVKKIENLNLDKFEYPKIQSSTELELQQEFSPIIQYMEHAFNIDVKKWWGFEDINS